MLRGEQQDYFNYATTKELYILKKCWNEKGIVIRCMNSDDTLFVEKLPELVYQTFYANTGEVSAVGSYNYKMAETYKQEYMQLHDSVSVYNRHKKPTFTMEKRDWEKRHPLEQFSIESICRRFAVGLWKEYRKNGQLSGQGNYKDFKHDGLWKTYYDNGQLSSEQLYEDGELISENWWDKNGERKYY